MIRNRSNLLDLSMREEIDPQDIITREEELIYELEDVNDEISQLDLADEEEDVADSLASLRDQATNLEDELSDVQNITQRLYEITSEPDELRIITYNALRDELKSDLQDRLARRLNGIAATELLYCIDFDDYVERFASYSGADSIEIYGTAYYVFGR